ncbi:MAG TPA: hypothetical protein DCQ04_08420 [Actinobacteria bacterium]|nr:hypothetical protein [Actinomycetota bacterium]
MAEKQFELIYDGTAVQDGRMAIAEIAPALVALEALTRGCSGALRPDCPPVVLSVSSTKQGSFIVSLIAESSPSFDRAIDVFSSDTADAVSNIKDFVEVLVLFFIWVRHRGKELLREGEPEPPTVEEMMAGRSLENEQPGISLLSSRPDLVRHARDVVAPLRAEGIDQMRIEGGGASRVVVQKAEVAYFDAAADESEEEEDHETTILLRIVNLSLSKGTSWRFSDGQTTFPARIQDAEFVDRVRLGEEVFRNGDFLRCRLRVRQRVDEEGKLRTKREVLEVIEHRRAYQHTPSSMDLSTLE